MKLFSGKFIGASLLLVILLVLVVATAPHETFADFGGKNIWGTGTNDNEPAPGATNPNCKVVSATLDPYTPEGSTSEKFYKDDVHPQVVITIKTEQCEKNTIYVSLVEASGISYATPGKIPELSNKKFIVPDANTFSITMGAGETGCYATSEITGNDCKYYVIAGPTTYGSLLTLGDNSYFSRGKPYGLLAYNCDTGKGKADFNGCGDSWIYFSDTSKETTGNTATVEDGGFTTGIDPNSACKDNTNCYAIFSGFSEALGNKFQSLDASQGLGGFLNGIIAWVIGIGGVLAVAMIMYEGFLYMKTDNVNTKGETKSKIFKTILGLLLLLTIYTILRTINPDLLNLTPLINTVTLDVPEGQDVTGALDDKIATDPAVAKIYSAPKGHWRDGGKLSSSTTESKTAVMNSVSESTLMDLTTKGVRVKSGSGKLIDPAVGNKIVAMDVALKKNNVSITVTEAFKPTTTKHSASCHYKATCIDADIPFNAQKVAILISEASKNGLVAVWETKNSNDYKALLAQGIPQSNVILFKGHITGDHASIYEYR